YTKKMMTQTENSACGSLTTTITEDELSHVDSPIDVYEPLYEYLSSKGITDRDDIDLAMDMAMAYDPLYSSNLMLMESSYFLDKELLKQDYVFPVPNATHITSGFGYRID